ncbi:MAGUK p55 subfamily member 2 [Labeo rohita]|uniref:MAGUK p55 subfamily member 2 n=1 Tax=Labeo rohita TaxID=84645 RepID=A0ABQ8LZQ7_LABRO|nr:MAGUK p55 subfamily member 2 [Labeo rohita]
MWTCFFPSPGAWFSLLLKTNFVLAVSLPCDYRNNDRCQCQVWHRAAASSTGAKDIDLIFLRGIMESPIVRSLAKAHERLEDVKLEAVQSNNVELVSEILSDMSSLTTRDESAAELCKILKEPHFQSLLEAHDKVASKSYEAPPTSPNSTSMTSSSLMPADTVRMISIQKKAGEPLGVTFRVEDGDLVITRVMHGSMIDRQGMLHAGDVIREVNGREVGKDPMALQHMLRDCNGSITLKILPSYRDTPPPAQVYLKPHFNYNPDTDNLIPCKEAGLAFSKGDILHIVNKEDPNWWQIYEEVAKMPPFQRKTLVLIGAQGVGRRSLKNRLIVLNPLRYGTTVPFTSRRPRDDEKDGQSYCFVSRDEMEMDIKGSRYLEHGEYDGNLYGTKIDSIHEVVHAGRTCILDVNPQTSEFMPFVVFIAAPELDTLRAMHKAVVDAGITTKLLTAFEKLQAAVEQLTTQPQWVPVNWVY